MHRDLRHAAGDQFAQPLPGLVVDRDDRALRHVGEFAECRAAPDSRDAHLVRMLGTNEDLRGRPHPLVAQHEAGHGNTVREHDAAPRSRIGSVHAGVDDPRCDALAARLPRERVRDAVQALATRHDVAAHRQADIAVVAQQLRLQAGLVEHFLDHREALGFFRRTAQADVFRDRRGDVEEVLAGQFGLELGQLPFDALFHDVHPFTRTVLVERLVLRLRHQEVDDGADDVNCDHVYDEDLTHALAVQPLAEIGRRAAE